MNSLKTSKRIFAPGPDASSHQAKQFELATLDRKDLDKDPLTQFHKWFSAATSYPVPQAEACTLSTAELPSGRVSARFVYLKELDDKGFVIYSNFGTSHKAADLETNKHASLTFWWRELEQQVRVEGKAERLSNAESQIYYDTRIRGSRIGAWASEQSKVIKDRDYLDERMLKYDRDFGTGDIPIPDFWGGLRILPDVVEFWQGRSNRLHDRFQYTKIKGTNGKGPWEIERLSP